MMLPTSFCANWLVPNKIVSFLNFRLELGDIKKLNTSFFIFSLVGSVELMVTESMSPVETNNEEKLHVPPGLASLTAFTLKRAEVVDNLSGPVGVENPNDLEISSGPSPFDIDGFASITRSLKFKQRPWIVYDQFQSEREPDVKLHDTVILVSS